MNPTNDTSTRKCAKCGQSLAVAAVFCRHCGTRYTQPAPPSPPPTPTPAPTSPAPAVSPVTAPGPKQGTRPGWLALAVVAGLVAVGAGAAAAIVVLGHDDSTTAKTDGHSHMSSVPTVPDAVAEGSGQANTSAGRPGFPTESRDQMARDIQALLLTYHQDVVTGQTQEAWGVLSARKRQQNLREYGYPKWAKAQASLAPYLDPSGLTVRIDALEAEGVARVLATGMGWSAPGASCTEWSGLTWVKYEQGKWTYDPGYSTTADRRRVWQPRSGELLGADC